MITLEMAIGSAVIAAVVTSIFNSFNNKKILQDSLDSKSGWREELFKVASKTIITSDDIYLILAALRYKPHKDIGFDENEGPKNFKEMTKYIYCYLSKIIENPELIEVSKEEGLNPLSKNEADKVRLLAKYLLKHHWEDLGNGYIGRLKFKVLHEKEIIEEIYEEVKK